MNTMENMNKVNFAFKGIEQEKKEFELAGVKVTAVRKIPYAEKVKCATFIAARNIMEDAETPGVYIHPIDVPVVDMQAKLHYYTNANVEGMSRDAIRLVYDNLYDDPGYMSMCTFVDDDWQEVLRMVGDLVSVVRRRIEAKAKNGFDMSGIMNAFMADPDPNATIAQNRELSERLIDAMRSVKE